MVRQALPMATSIFGEHQIASPIVKPREATVEPSTMTRSHELVSTIAHMLIETFEFLTRSTSPCLKPVIVGGYAHMTYFQQASRSYAALGTHEYGMRDIDMVLVPTTSDWTTYVTESSSFAERIDTMLNQKSQAIKQMKHLDTFVETTQASADYAVMTRKQCSSFNVQRVMKGSEYGTTYVFRLDSHQLVNVTVLSRDHFHDAIEWVDSYLVFPAFRFVCQRFSRPLLRVCVVTRSYLQKRL
jgi:hypothetical protein